MSKIAFAALAAVVTVVCGAAWSHVRSARAAGEPAQRWGAAEAKALDVAVEDLEERLLAHQARVAFWQEMRSRHQQVAAVACANLGEHAVALRQADSRQQVRLADRKGRRVASAVTQ